MEKKQNDLINLLRGFTIYLLLFAHSLQCFSTGAAEIFDIEVYKVLASFGMPLFAMVSGYLFWYSLQKRTFVEVVTRRTRQMLQPMVMCGTIVCLTSELIHEIFRNGISVLGDFLIEGVMTDSFVKYWFLWAALSCSIVTAIIWKGIKKPAHRALAFIPGFFLFCLFPFTERGIFLYPFFTIGLVFHEYEEPLKNRLKNLLFVPLIVYPILCYFFRGDYLIDASGIKAGSTFLESLGINMYRWITGIFGSLFVVIVLGWLYRKFNNGTAKKVFDFFVFLGKKSLQIYCLQVLFLEKWAGHVFRLLVNTIGKNYLFINGLFQFVFAPLIALAFAFVLLKLIVWMDKKGVSQYIFGR